MSTIKKPLSMTPEAIAARERYQARKNNQTSIAPAEVKDTVDPSANGIEPDHKTIEQEAVLEGALERDGMATAEALINSVDEPEQSEDILSVPDESAAEVIAPDEVKTKKGTTKAKAPKKPKPKPEPKEPISRKRFDKPTEQEMHDARENVYRATVAYAELGLKAHQESVVARERLARAQAALAKVQKLNPALKNQDRPATEVAADLTEVVDTVEVGAEAETE